MGVAQFVPKGRERNEGDCGVKRGSALLDSPASKKVLKVMNVKTKVYLDLSMTLISCGKVFWRDIGRMTLVSARKMLESKTCKKSLMNSMML